MLSLQQVRNEIAMVDEQVRNLNIYGGKLIDLLNAMENEMVKLEDAKAVPVAAQLDVPIYVQDLSLETKLRQEYNAYAHVLELVGDDVGRMKMCNLNRGV